MYVTSLERMRERAGADRRAFPGHGAVISDAKEKLEEYIVHRQMREDEALDVLCFGSTTTSGKTLPKTTKDSLQSTPSPMEQVDEEVKVGMEWETMELVKIIYRLYPENLWGPAEGGLLQILHKLEGNGKVVMTTAGKWKVSESTIELVRANGANFRGQSPSKL
jgi:hypothetical protein